MIWTLGRNHARHAMTVDTHLTVEKASDGYDWTVTHFKGGTGGGTRRTLREAKKAAEQCSERMVRRERGGF